MSKKITQRIKLWGIVQGVGFRPFVAKIADRMEMKGEVLNIGGLVEIVVTDTEERIGEFVKAIETEKPGPAEIVHIKITEEEYREFETFTSSLFAFSISHSATSLYPSPVFPETLNTGTSLFRALIPFM